MTHDSIGVAVIGGGMAGRAHAAGYRMASTLFGTDRPDVRLVAVADTNAAVADDTAKRYGYERAEYDWQSIAAADDIDVVSVVVANHLHREIVEGLLAAGKNVLCEKPLAGSLADAESMVAAASASSGIASVGYTYRRSPAVQAIADELAAGRLGDIVHFDGRYRADYSLDPTGPMTWRYRGGPGTGALADVGSHLIDLAEYVAGPITEVRGAQFATVITERPVPVGVTYGHTKAETTGEMAPVENEDVATFTVAFAGGFVGTFSASRVSHANPDGLSFDVFGTKGSASWALERAAEFHISTTDIDDTVNGRRQVIIGPQHPYIRGGLPMDAGGVGHGKAEFFAYQARAFLDQVAGIDGLPPLPDFAHGLRGLQLVAAITESAANNGIAVKI
ncbi:Gfo/Idh/MocA family oxidoreductase [Rhodococcus sp. BP-149]|uniref:Gfo/Idh/MocA family protein n=1 Tax=unclassified Rhodococcus (in: high G+C Gram-positive bacteria) TaxID=192944 RepID=UPI001C9B4D12|nr:MULTISPECIES: Gfo/Idh/MocA family oxidoreductase [unclassified Rhodococcus (in: high G+C Gram-positive bacteria)]MBY6686144.1 Gfo/Idh/MocA family oxidoreductase [Rhodococcus sp. BP-288]MBY6693766.1 Gfo/Idh/MocA family oxidoreductase [Rhodococcus sp. BP-188]MBY6699637.1 Gfo/Idh/MocA family oxidoreductase [Rhodococcus sp. BP-285]MBY6704018.1 Gfo/Idh/MocA family oxidoreductase [Rhodococcus sp. BP-283]MBY6710833.1 Gfo/Idh/MocA family oxidoreductase [Rhodococcus sp. BP-160]